MNILFSCNQDYKRIDEISDIRDAIRFGYFINDLSHREIKSIKRIFAFISSPGNLPIAEFILLGAILRNQHDLRAISDINTRCKIRHFIRLWEAGRDCKSITCQNRPSRLSNLIIPKSLINEFHNSPENIFRTHPEYIHRLCSDFSTPIINNFDNVFRIEFSVKNRNLTNRIEHVIPQTSMDYHTNNLNHATQLSLLDKLEDLALSEIKAGNFNKSHVFFCGGSKKVLMKVLLRNDNFEMSLWDLMNLDPDGPNKAKLSGKDGCWFPSSANRQTDRLKGIKSLGNNGLAIYDGPKSWSNWESRLCQRISILVFPRISKYEGYSSVCDINTSIHNDLTSSLTTEFNYKTSWFQDCNPIQAFVYGRS